MKFIPLELSDVMVVEPHRVEDERGFFWETHRDDAFAQVGITCA
ncbi:dTDP-4-dehydrorhamnose 3,5-epimerase family protein, partial [Acinetobacter baumannii]